MMSIPDAVTVELYAEGQKDESAVTLTMNRGERMVGATNAFIYSVAVPKGRPVC